MEMGRTHCEKTLETIGRATENIKKKRKPTLEEMATGHKGNSQHKLAKGAKRFGST